MRKRWLGIALVIVLLGGVGAGWLLRIAYYPPILMYHSLDPERTDTPAVSEETFARHLRYLKEHDYRVVPVEELVAEIKKGHIPRRTVAITFDDGYEDNLKAVRLLKEYDFPATIFVIVGRIGEEGYLSPEDLRQIETHTKVRIGSHTIHHYVLYEAPDPELEIRGSKARLEEILGHEVRTISYPVGGFNREIMRLVKEAGYCCAFTTNRGYSRRIDIYALRRIKMKDSDKGLGLWFKLSGYYDLFRRIRSPE